MKKNVLILMILSMCIFTNAKAQQSIKLWPDNPPTNNNLEGKDNEPELVIYKPEKADNTRKAIIICPGGGYARLAFEHEGTQFAQWLAEQGITGIILRYRLPNKHKEVPLDDAQQAIRYVRQHAKELGIDTNKVGISGFSAGGHLASTASTHYTTDVRPDFSVLFYPVITMTEKTHLGSKNNLLGDKPTQQDIYIYSNEKQVNSNTPPAILLLSSDDKSVLPENSIKYYNALLKNNISATMYIFPTGGHGWGMRKNFKYHEEMLILLAKWLKDIC